MKTPLNILYVDDESINLKLFTINLSKKYNIYTALDGVQALEVLDKEKDMDIIMSDMKMPKMNGLEFINTAKHKIPNAYYYILTGYDTTDEIQSAINTGLINKCFRKPFNMVEIEREIIKVSSK